MIGETFGGYRITSKIGAGGMGEVFAADHPLIGRKIAIKILSEDLSQDEEGLARFFKEARATASLKHPAFADVLDVGITPKGQAFIMMELLEGQSLGARLRRERRLPVADAIAIARDVAKGMVVAHEAGIIHRDLKPDNIFLCRANGSSTSPLAVKILDFGVAKLHIEGEKKLTSTRAVLGTPLYMSPEQCRGAGQVDLRTDIYTLGCVLYAMLTGAPPFTYEGEGELIGAHMNEPAPPPRRRVPELPEALNALILRTLAKTPSTRPATMKAFAEELDALWVGLHAGASTAAIPHPEAAVAAAPAPLPPIPSPVQARSEDAARVRSTEVLEVVAAPPVAQRLRKTVTAALSPSEVASSRARAGDTQRLPDTDTPTGAQDGGAGQLSALVESFASEGTTLRNAAAELGGRSIQAPAPLRSRSRVERTARVPAGTLLSRLRAHPYTLLGAGGAAVIGAVLLMWAALPPQGRHRQLARAHDEEPRAAIEVVPPEPLRLPAEEAPLPLPPPPESPPVKTVSPKVANAPKPRPPRAEVQIAVPKLPPQARVTLDGRQTRLPLRLRRDRRLHILHVESPGTRPEDVSFVADHDQSLTLANRPALFRQ